MSILRKAMYRLIVIPIKVSRAFFSDLENLMCLFIYIHQQFYSSRSLEIRCLVLDEQSPPQDCLHQLMVSQKKHADQEQVPLNLIIAEAFITSTK